jgi:IS1 family transposase
LVQRFKCTRCGQYFSETQPLDGIRVAREDAAQVVEMLAETMGIRAASRLARLDKGTILRILESAGEHCAKLLDARIRNVTVAAVQCDEVFSYVGKKPNGMPDTDNDSEQGEMWTFFSIAHREKLIINWRVSKRTGEAAEAFLRDLKGRLACRIQLTTDAFRGYCAIHGPTGNVARVFGDACDYATEHKRIKTDSSYVGQRAYFAPKQVRVYREDRCGNPNMAIATTNHAERTNLSLRTFTRRFVRKTLNFSKKLANHRHAVAIFVAHFNFCRVHGSLGGKTPAMAAGLTDHVWTVEELLSAS